jgi:hypothetical protein
MLPSLFYSTLSVLIVLYCWLRYRYVRRALYLPDALVLSLAMFAGGVLWLDRQSNSTAVDMLAGLGQTALLGGLLGALCVAAVDRSIDGRLNPTETVLALEARTIRTGLLLCLGVNIIFVAVLFGTSSIRTLLLVAFSDSSQTLLAARKAITAGTEGYLAPGLVKQFRDILAPMFICAVLMRGRSGVPLSLICFTGLTTIGAMILSGQRFPALAFLAAAGASQMVGAHIRGRRIGWASIVAFGGVALTVYTLLTVLLGRASRSSTVLDQVTASTTNLFERVLLVVPGENMRTFTFWGNQGPTWGGSWLADLGILLPGTNSALANTMHSLAGGSLQGNSPLALPVDSWFAWGWPGVLVVPAVFAISLGRLDLALIRTRLGLGYAARNVIFFAVPMMYSPYLAILYGGLAGAAVLALLIFLGSLGLHHSRRTDGISVIAN